jgi:hypothetical protein
VNNLYKVSSAISLLLGGMFILSAIGLIISIIFIGIDSNWFSLLQNNWLIVIFKLHAGIINISDDPSHGIHLLDILILVLFSIMCYSLRTVLKKTNKIWSLIAFVLSVISIILFIATQIAGRSTVMLVVMIFSIIMLKNKIFDKVTISSGILAGVFLFIGDLTVGIHSNIITILFGIGYILLTTWFIRTARILLRLAYLQPPQN